MVCRAEILWRDPRREPGAKGRPARVSGGRGPAGPVLCRGCAQPGEAALSPAGTSFQQAFWDLLREIPFGSVVTYGDLTRALAQRQGRTSLSPQAVGGTQWGNKKYMNLKHLEAALEDASIAG